MRSRATLLLPFLALLSAAVSLTQTEPPAAPGGMKWYKGNLHTHTLNSDGDSTPAEVATWYREHAYHFLVLTDHNYLTEVAGLNSTVGAKERFVLISGEEVSARFNNKALHVNGFNIREVVQPQEGATVSALIENNVNAIRKAHGLPSLCHPNFHWAVNADDMKAAKGLTHFEVYNGHPQVNNDGGGGSPSLEQMWDALLTAGRPLYGIAVDDAHHFKRFGRQFSNPGHGWVWVRAAALTPESITAALEKGEFYSSTGVKLADVRVTASEYALELERASWEKTTTHFIGAGGKVLASSFDQSPRYRFTGTEGYVRARVESSAGTRAWTQPVFPRR